MDKKALIGLFVVIACFIMGCLSVKLYQPMNKSMTIYSDALKDYNNGEYQNSYYLFSRISFFSKLKPYAIYHQAMCAKELSDSESEMKQYQLLFNNYTKTILSIRARYLAAQMLMKDNPKQAQKYFEHIITNNPDTDYAIASEYYLGVLKLNEYRDAEIFPNSKKHEIEIAFRHYLTKAPQGRLALNAITNWLSLDTEIYKDDYLLMANTYYLFSDYENAKKMLAKTDIQESWVLDAKTSYATRNYNRARSVIAEGLQKYAGYVSTDDIYDVVNIYMQLSNSKTADINYLYNISAPNGKDYIWTMKCDIAPVNYQAACYKQLYLNFPKGNYAASALANIFFDKIRARDYINAEKIGKDYLNKFPNTVSAPKVMFWLGKISERRNDYKNYMNYYVSTINKYPDTYYAYRAYIAMKHINKPLLNANIIEKPVAFPYQNVSQNDIIIKLAELKDYEILDLITDDDFIKSWIYYQKGDFAHSMLLARDAMEKINPKPDKTDLRWRLVYPLNYYAEVEKHAFNPELMMSIIREESFFNPNAQSSVGARGLMQIMPATAKGFAGVDAEDLFKPELNIKIGTSYYSSLRSMLNGDDISAVASYNGGIGSINKWLKRFDYADIDEFVEQIPYAETQNYVKKVFRTYWNYLRVYTF